MKVIRQKWLEFVNISFLAPTGLQCGKVALYAEILIIACVRVHHDADVDLRHLSLLSTWELCDLFEVKQKDRFIFTLTVLGYRRPHIQAELSTEHSPSSLKVSSSFLVHE